MNPVPSNEETELTLTRRAARGRWNVSNKIKEDSIKTIERILESGADPELKLNAINTAATLDRIDLKEDEIHTPQRLILEKTPTTQLLKNLAGLIGEDTCNKIRQKLLPSIGEFSTNPSASAVNEA